VAPGGATGAPTSVILIVCAVSELHVSRGLRVCLNLKRKGPFGQVASISRSRFGSRRAGASDKHKKAREDAATEDGCASDRSRRRQRGIGDSRTTVPLVMEGRTAVNGYCPTLPREEDGHVFTH
jgi:hypothetical protein